MQIYGLYCPDSNDLRYIGKAKDAAKRLLSHISDARRAKRPVCNWIRGLAKEGKVPLVKVLETVSDDVWEAAEKRLIAEHRLTSKLLNLADGGAMPSQTKEQRLKAVRASNAKQKQADPRWQRLMRLKRDMGRHTAKMLRTGRYDLYWTMRSRMHYLYLKDPATFCGWALK